MDIVNRFILIAVSRIKGLNEQAVHGLLIYMKDNLRKGVKLMKNDNDSIIWFKLDKNFFSDKIRPFYRSRLYHT